MYSIRMLEAKATVRDHRHSRWICYYIKCRRHVEIAPSAKKIKRKVLVNYKILSEKVGCSSYTELIKK